MHSGVVKLLCSGGNGSQSTASCVLYCFAGLSLLITNVS